jgi:hypothetical protein
MRHSRLFWKRTSWRSRILAALSGAPVRQFDVSREEDSPRLASRRDSAS